MAMPAGYKPSPLGYGSPRSSPFRRPESPASPSPLRQTTPTSSPTKLTNSSSTARFANNRTPMTSNTPGTTDSWTPRGRVGVEDTPKSSSLEIGSRMTTTSRAPPAHGNSLSKLQPSQLRTLREGFQILDRDSDGVVNRDDVTDMLNQLGLPSNPADVSRLFPSSAPQTMAMSVFINSLADTLAAMSPSAELLSAFSAFDTDDSGQIDLVELRDALLHTAPEPGERPLTEMEVDKVINGFTGRRAFDRSMHGGLGKRGEVFKYQDFVNSIMGSNGNSEPNSAEGPED